MIWLALFALIFYPPLPIMIIFIHKTMFFWRPWGKKAYYAWIAGFVGLFCLLGSLVFSYLDPILEWRLYGYSSWIYLGLIPLAGGIALGILSVRTLSLRVLLGLPEIFPQIKSPLVIHGIYKYIRHPRYLEFILEVLGIAILSGLVWNFILLLCFIPAANLMAYVEEQELLKRFGSEYREYMTRTNRFFFFPGSPPSRGHA